MIDGKKTIAICTSRINDVQMFNFIKRFNDEIIKNDYRLLVFTLNTDLYWDEDGVYPETAVFKLIPYPDIEAIIIMDEKIKSHTVARSIIERAHKHDVPVFVIDGNYEDTVNINFDYVSGFEEIVRHVVKYHGVRNPHMMAGIKDNVFSDERIEAFKTVLAENDIPFSDDMVSYGDFWSTPARKATKKLLERDTLPDAIICANDYMAINVMDVLMSAGIKVPDDVIVTGFDGIEEAAICSPRLSTVNCDISDIASHAAIALMEYIDEGKKDYFSIVPKICPGQSCGCGKENEYNPNFINHLNSSIYRYQDDLRTLLIMSVNMQLSDGPDGLVSYLKEHIPTDYARFTHDLCIIAETDCFDPSKDILNRPTPESRDNIGFSTLYNSLHPEESLLPLGNNILLPHMNEFFDMKIPLIFNAISYLGKPLGYICYFYKDYDIVEYSNIANTTNAFNMGLGGFITMRRQQYLSDTIAEMYKLDTLTGLYNRAGFKDVFKKMLKDHEGESMTTIMTDLDGLKYINDTFGHEEGDRAISAVACAFKSSCPKDAYVMRFGGDEMIAFIPGDCDPEKVMNDTYARLEMYNKKETLPYVVSASCGADKSTISLDLDLETVVREADLKMYDKKHSR